MVSWVLIVQIYEDFASEQNPNWTIFTSGQALTRRCGVLETSPSFLIHLTWATRQETLSHLKCFLVPCSNHYNIFCRTNIIAMSTFLKRSSPPA